MSMSKTYHPLVKGLLDGERSLADLPPELRAEAEEAERLLGAVDRTPVSLSPALDARVMAAVRRRAASPGRRAWRRLVEPREFELRLRIRPWIAWGGALAVAAATALVVLGRPSVIPAGGPTPTRVASRRWRRRGASVHRRGRRSSPAAISGASSSSAPKKRIPSPRMPKPGSPTSPSSSRRRSRTQKHGTS